MDETVERRARGRPHHPTIAGERPALQGRQCPDALGDAFGKGYVCPIWITYKQASELGGQVRKGEHGSLVVYANRIRRSETDDKGEQTEREIPFMKGYTVFNVEQVAGLPAHFYAKPEAPYPLPNGLPPPTVSLPQPA